MIAVCAACSGGGPSSAAKKAFVDAQAAGFCAVKGHKFTDEHAQHDAYVTAASRTAISAADLRALQHELATDSALRAAITDRVATTCP